MRAAILTIGEEILIGDTIDTNSAWMGRQLNLLGIDVRKVISVGDHAHEIEQSLNEAKAIADLILITGGLGPTKDDVTKKTLADYFGMQLVQNAALEADLRAYFERRKRKFLPMHAAMASLPEGALLLNNPLGTAPGMWFESADKIVISMPGVPYEMKAIMTEQVLPKLKREFSLPVIEHKYFYTAGRGESQLADKIADIEAGLPDGYSIAYLPGKGKVKVRLTGRGNDLLVVRSELERIGGAIFERLAKYTYSQEVGEHVSAIAEMMSAKGFTLGTAESCTGGNIARQITALSGSSRYYNGSIVAYSNDVKMKLLDVNASTLEEHGAVSEQTVREMVKGTLKHLAVDYAIATSGVAGPTGGSPEKPVGTVWIAVGNSAHTVAKKFTFAKDRGINIELSSVVGLEMLRRMLLGTLNLKQ
ncbi:MAG: CinA family nicotinamide mononucleotide deamidase-related protein [Saprospiraceae bacterium]|nr:CinA family nicotinamide mononucleotide deamidase-related protein [Saprospiraceae bacterium]